VKGPIVSRQSCSRLLLLAALAALPAGATAQSDQAPQPAAGGPVTNGIAATDVPQLAAALTARDASQEERDTAARRLLARPDPAALRAIVEALENNNARPAQLAAVRALARLAPQRRRARRPTAGNPQRRRRQAAGRRGGAGPDGVQGQRAGDWRGC
jgi:HEAT repeat protein